jgi:hypothetical protein
MSIDVNELHALPDAEKLRIVEMLWDDLGGFSDNAYIPLINRSIFTAPAGAPSHTPRGGLPC